MANAKNKCVWGKKTKIKSKSESNRKGKIQRKFEM